MNPTAEGRARYFELCRPYYRHRRDQPASPARAIRRDEVALHFNGPRNEHGRMDFRAHLAKLRCPVLMMAGEEDPIVPIELGEMTARHIPAHLLHFERLAGCSHDAHRDDPERVFRLMRDFITKEP